MSAQATLENTKSCLRTVHLLTKVMMCEQEMKCNVQKYQWHTTQSVRVYIKHQHLYRHKETKLLFLFLACKCVNFLCQFQISRNSIMTSFNVTTKVRYWITWILCECSNNGLYEELQVTPALFTSFQDFHFKTLSHWHWARLSLVHENMIIPSRLGERRAPRRIL